MLVQMVGWPINYYGEIVFSVEYIFSECVYQDVVIIYE